jgi:acyl dehydratase
MTMATVFESLEELPGAVGTHLGYSDWLTIDQERIDLFAEATGDHQWIHVDSERAVLGPFGSTIAHGYLTLSLTSMFLPALIEVRGISMGINYGTDKVRFPAPVPVGSRVRAGAELVDVAEVVGGFQTVIRITMEMEGSERPACVVESVSRFLR